MIVAAMGLKSATTGDKLCTASAPILLERIDTYEPVISQAIEPSRWPRRRRWTSAWASLAGGGSHLQVHEDTETAEGGTIIRGMGELHLEVIVDRLTREYGAKARVGKPQVVFRETIGAPPRPRASSSASSRTSRSRQGPRARRPAGAPRPASLYGHGCPSSAVPPNIVAAAHDRAEGLAVGPGGYPMEDLEVTVLAIETRDGASPEIGTKIAASNAFRARLRRGRPAPARAHHGRSRWSSRGVPRRRHRRSQPAPWPHRGRRLARREADHPDQGAAAAHVRLLDGAPPLSQGRATYSMQFAESNDAWD
jgi:elongation factor G